MAASYTAERKTGVVAFGGSISITPASNCTTGSTLLLLLASDSNFSVVSSISDTKGNSWHTDVAANTNGGIAILSSYQTSGLTTGDTISVTLTANMATCYWLEEFAANYSVADVTASILTSGSTTAGTGTTATTTTADEIAACFVVSASAVTITKNASYTLFTTGQQTPGTGSASAWYRILAATGTQSGNGTLSTMANSTGAIATYKAGTAAAVIPDVGMALTVT